MSDNGVWVTLKELSARTRIKVETLYRWVRIGRIEHRREPAWPYRVLVKDVPRGQLMIRRRCADPKCNRLFRAMEDRQIYHTPQCCTRHKSRVYARKKARERREQGDL